MYHRLVLVDYNTNMQVTFWTVMRTLDLQH